MSLICFACKQDHTKPLKHWCDISSLEIEHQALQKENEQQKTTIKELVEALEFYANRENWQDLNERTEPNNASSIIDDSDEFGVDKWNDQYLFGGKRARQALEKNIVKQALTKIKSEEDINLKPTFNLI